MAAGAGSDKVLFLCLLSFLPAHVGHVSCRNPTKKRTNPVWKCEQILGVLSSTGPAAVALAGGPQRAGITGGGH